MNRATVLLVAVLMLISVVAGSTVAYLVDRTNTVENTFEYATVSCKVTENFDNTTKSNVKVKNTGTTDAYIRATYVINWLDKDGKTIVASVPAGYSYRLEDPTDDWKEIDGYYYYLKPVAPGKSTEGSLLTCTVSHPTNPEYTLSVEILATAIQSQPVSAVKDAWGVTPQAGN